MYGYGVLGTFTYGSMPTLPTFPSAGASERILFLDGRDSDLATLSTLNGQSMPVANLQTRSPSQKWRSALKYDQILFTFPYPVAPNALAWIGHNHTGSGYYRMFGADSAAATLAAPVVTKGWTSVWPLGVKPRERQWASYTSLLRWPNETMLTHWLLEVTDSGVGIDFIQAGRAMLGRYWQPRNNVDVSPSLAITSTDPRRKSPWGAIHTSRRPTGRTAILPFSASDEADAIDQATEMQRQLGSAGDFVVSLNPAQSPRFHRMTMHGSLAQTNEFQLQPTFRSGGSQFWKFVLTVEELIF